jgi:hypothetical protein
MKQTPTVLRESSVLEPITISSIKSKTINSAKRRRYFGSYLSVSITDNGGGSSPYPVCILYHEVLFQVKASYGNNTQWIL